MGGFFKPLRRKIGVVTLAVACVFAAEWVRSLRSRDFVFLEFEIPMEGRINVYTSANQLDVLLQESTGWHFDFGEVDPIVKMSPLEGVWFFDVQEIEEQIFDGVQDVAPGYHVKIYFFAIVIPLTLLSAWLLLSKPRIAKTRENQPQKI